MWSLREKKNGSFYLTYDHSRYYNNKLRGIWEYVGPKDLAYTSELVRINEKAGYLTCVDDENNVRVLVLES